MEILIECADAEYGIVPDSYRSGEAPSMRGHPDNWDAGSGPEIDFPLLVNWYRDGKRLGKVSWDEMITRVAEDRGVSREVAENQVSEYCYEYVADHYDDEYKESW